MYKIITILFLCICNLANAQRKNSPSVEEVSIAKELKLKYEDEDIILQNKKVKITFARSKKGQVEAIIKREFDFLNIGNSSRLQLPVFYDSESTVEELTLRDKRGKEVFVETRDENMQSADLFHTDYRVKYANISFPLQGYKYRVVTKKRYQDVKYFTSEYLTDRFRIEKGSITIVIPKWLELEIKEFNFDEFQIEKKEVNGDNLVVTYTYSGMDPQVQESYTLGPSYVYPHLLFIARSFKNKNETVRLFTDTSDLYKWYNGLIKSVEVDKSVFADKVKELAAAGATDQEKIENIFYWVQDNIRYIAFEDGIAGFKPDSPQNVYKKRYGDCKGMAILTKTMLEEAGFESKLVWIGTDRLAYDYSIPSLTVDNHMICAVELNGETVFLDGTEKYNRFGEFATRIQNKQALVQDGDSFKIMTVPATEVSNVDKTSYQLQVQEESLIGKATRSFSGESRVFFQNGFHSLGNGDKDEVMKKYLASNNKNYLVKSIAPFEDSKREKDIKIDFNVSIDNAASEFDGTIYLDLDPIKSASSYILKDRKSDFNHPFKEKSITEINLAIPEGYSNGALPENLEISNEWVKISVRYKKEGNSIRFTKEIDFVSRLVKKENIDTWNAGFEQLRDNLNQQITLTKN